MRFRVVCGFGETMATLRPTSVLTSVDFPALGRPTMATKPDLKGMRELYASGANGETPRRKKATPPLTRPGVAHAREVLSVGWLREHRNEVRRLRLPRRCAERGPRRCSAGPQSWLHRRARKIRRARRRKARRLCPQGRGREAPWCRLFREPRRVRGGGPLRRSRRRFPRRDLRP